jgi:crotonobetainyl-CoA:carnitine CoA-transferase CaiB-like acyl-CoA transferase
MNRGQDIIESMKPLTGVRLLSLAVNVPGPVAVARLVQLGVSATKFEPPNGDPLATAAPAWYEALHEGISVNSVDLKSTIGQRVLQDCLAESDLLITASRPASLERMGLDWPTLATSYSRLCQVAIIGRRPPFENKAGHDLTYQAGLGLVEPPIMPKIMVADLAGAERAVSAALALLLSRERAPAQPVEGSDAGENRYTQVALEESAKAFAAPLHYGLTAPGGLLAGTLPIYNLYPAEQGWVAVAALERHFMVRLLSALKLTELAYERLAEIFLSKPAGEWERWAVQHDLPIVAVHQA